MADLSASDLNLELAKAGSSYRIDPQWDQSTGIWSFAIFPVYCEKPVRTGIAGLVEAFDLIKKEFNNAIQL